MYDPLAKMLMDREGKNTWFWAAGTRAKVGKLEREVKSGKINCKNYIKIL